MVAYKTKPYGYQYETSPRKLQTDSKVEQHKKKNSTKTKASSSAKYNYKVIVYIAIGFIMLATICYRNSLINESYNKKEKLKTELSEVQKENEQLKVGIESGLNLSSVEKIAKEQLGMQKLTSSQKIYVNLQKKDYVESATEEVVIEKDTSIFEKVLNSLTKIIK